jgi:uncharacterized protein YcbK (DUF882 family)
MGLLPMLIGFTLAPAHAFGFYPTSEFVHVDTGRVRFW